MPLHLETHVEAAAIVGSEPADVSGETLEWRFEDPGSEWTLADPGDGDPAATTLEYVDGALRVTLAASEDSDEPLRAAIAVDVPLGQDTEWARAIVRARAGEGIRHFVVGGDTSTDRPQASSGELPFEHFGQPLIVVNDGTTQSYEAPLPTVEGDGTWRRLGLRIEATYPDVFEVLSIALSPAAGEYTEPVGVRSVAIDRVYRHTLFTHTPGEISYRVLVPREGKLDVDLGVVDKGTPVRFQVSARDGAAEELLLDEVYDDTDKWRHHAVDLSALGGRTVTLSLRASADSSGTVALWGSPTISGVRATDRPNVIFYVIDGAGADYLSAYGYNRRTTPTLERLAEQGVLFEHAYSNADWTRPSTASFMTSLQHSVLGGFKRGFNVIPENAPTMAERMHDAGYQTAAFTANPNAGRMSGLERGVDAFKEDWAAFNYETGRGDSRDSSRHLNEAFWNWREEYPVQPYWVHFQTVDVHQEVPARPPFSGLFVSPEKRRTWRTWNARLQGEVGSHGVYSPAYERTGISRVDFFTLHQGIHDENMAHNDHHLGRLVESLRASGEWDNTLLVVGSDHSVKAAMDDMGIATLETLPPRWSNPSFRPSISRVPLLVVWPGRIPAGRRVDETVSMIDVLPTILDLVGLPPADVSQGQSLKPLLLGEEGWQPRPVIIEQLNADGFVQDEYSRIGVVDGRWGASLEISPAPGASDDLRRPVPLLLYDLWNDPMCLNSLHEERPDLVREYTEFLEAQFAAHQALAGQFTPGADVSLTPEQLQALRALGYIQ